MSPTVFRYKGYRFFFFSREEERMHVHIYSLVGKDISEVEVLNISKHGFWLLVHGQEYFLPFEQFPWFEDASIASILNVELPQPHHLYWPDLDVDLELESLDSPERYPLVDSQGLASRST